MRRLSRLSIITAFVFFITCTLSAQAQQLNGIATYSELRHEYYIAALFTDATSNEPSKLLASDKAQRLEMHLLATLPKRRWANMWTQSVAINNSAQALNDGAEELAEFLNVFKDDLQSGDRVVVSYQPGRGTKTTVNNIALLQNQSQAFFKLLLNTWIGPVPPSTDFRKAILGLQQNEPLLSRFESVKPSKARSLAIANWIKPPEPELTPEPEPKPEPSKPLPKPKEEIKPTAETIAKVKTPGTPAQEEQETAAESLAEKITTGEEPSLPETSEPEITHSTTDTPDNTVEKHAVNDEKKHAAEIEYTAMVIKSIYKKIRYPASAIRRGWQGQVDVLLTLNNDGTIANLEIEQGAIYPVFDGEALRAVESAAPFPGFAETITTQTMTLTIPVVFRLQE